MKPAIEELLRFSSPVDGSTDRVAFDGYEIAGVSIPRGERVLAVLGSANRDPAQFQNPEQLDLGREPNRHLAFGFGIHYCLGAPLARLEAAIALETLLRRLPDLKLRVPRDRLRWRKSLLVRGLEALPLSFRAARAAA